MSILSRLRDGSLLGAAGRDITYLSSGAFASQIVLIVGQIATARLYTPDQFGWFAVILAWANILAVVATLRYEMAIPLAETDDEARALTRLCLVTATLVALVVLACLGGAVLRGVTVLKVGGAWWAIPLVLWGTATFAATRMLAGRVGRFARVGHAGVVASVGQVGVQVGFGLVGWAPGLGAGQGVGRVINAAWIGTGGRLRGLGSTRAAARRWRRMPLLNTVPALLNVVSVGAVAPLVERWYGVVVAGQFGFATRLLAAPAVLLGQAVSQVLLPRLAHVDREQGSAAPQIRRAASALTLVALPVFSIVWLLGPEVFALVFGERWRDAGVMAAVMAPWLAANFVSSPLATYATVRDRLGQIFLISLAEATVRVVGLSSGVLAGSPLVGVAMYSVAGLGICMTFTSWVLGLAGVSRRDVLADLTVPFLVAATVAALSVLTRWAGLGSPAVVGVGVIGATGVTLACATRLMRELPGRPR